MNEININTLEGWNNLARLSAIDCLKGRGIEPTENNIKSYLKDLRFICEMDGKTNPPKPLDIVAVTHTTKSNSANIEDEFFFRQ